MSKGDIEGVKITVIEEHERIDRPAGLPPLVSKWCDCEDEPDFRCYPEDGACGCGVHKHHVHGTCGHILQVG